jgi:hypothetical protein
VTRPKRANPRPMSRFEFAAQLKKERKEVGEKLASIAVSLGALGKQVDRAAQRAVSFPTSSIIGSVVQVPQADPATERAWDFLDLVDRELKRLRSEAG